MTNVQVYYNDYKECKKYLIFLTSTYGEVLHIKYEPKKGLNVYNGSEAMFYFKNGNKSVTDIFNLLISYTFYEDDDVKIQFYKDKHRDFETEHTMYSIAKIIDS